MTIQLLSPSDEDAYHQFLLETPGSLFYYSLKYRDFLKQLLNCSTEYYVFKERTKITGALPLMKQTGRFGTVYNSLPYYGSHGGILCSHPSVAAPLLSLYTDLISANVAAATLIENPLHPLDYGTIPTTFEDRRISQITPLSPTQTKEELFNIIDSSTRRNINKATASGITVEVDNAMLPFVEQIHIENMKAIGGKAKNHAFFSLIPQYFSSGIDYDVYVAKKDGDNIAALLLFYFKETVEYFTPVIKEEYRTFQPLALIVFQAMVDAASRGFTQWNWGGTWLTQEGVYRFKKKWGSLDREYRYYINVNDKRILGSSTTELLQEYPDFYVVPFHALQPTVAAEEQAAGSLRM